MNCKEKKWFWSLTGPFASNNYTIIGHTIYFPKGQPPNKTVIAHEEVHEKQWMKVGFWKWNFLYLAFLPFFWNPWRKKWEVEAYMKGDKLSEANALKAVAGKSYGWVA